MSQAPYRSINVPPDMGLRQESSRGISQRSITSWATYISTLTGVSMDRCDMQYANSQSSHVCPCTQQLRLVHRIDCSCVCDYCKMRRLELCPFHQLQRCVCPIVCHCTCHELCHKNDTGKLISVMCTNISMTGSHVY